MIMQMHRAVYANDEPQLRRFISLRPLGLKQRDHHGNTPLLLALKLARVEMAWLLIRGGAELDVPSDGSFHLLVSAVMWASYRARSLDLIPRFAASFPPVSLRNWRFHPFAPPRLLRSHGNGWRDKNLPGIVESQLCWAVSLYSIVGLVVPLGRVATAPLSRVVFVIRGAISLS